VTTAVALDASGWPRHTDGVERYGTVLGIWAHPDDESYLSAGFFMRARSFGDSVVCVTATRGELGSTDPDRWPPGPELADLRTQESDVAMRHFDVNDHHWLDYPDGGCAEIPDEEAVERLVPIAELVQPDVITTFAPGGMTGHPDHQAVSRWTSLLVPRLSKKPAVLHAVAPDSYRERFLPTMQSLGVFMDGALPDFAPDEQCVHLQLTAEELERKWQGLVAQRSQTEGLFAAAGHEFMREYIATESFIEMRN